MDAEVAAQLGGCATSVTSSGFASGMIIWTEMMVMRLGGATRGLITTVKQKTIWTSHYVANNIVPFYVCTDY